MRYFFYSFGLIISLSLFVNDSYAYSPASEVCVFGSRNSTPIVSTTSCSNIPSTYSLPAGYVAAEVKQISPSSCYLYGFTDFNCAREPFDDSKESGCYSSDLVQNQSGDMTCYGEEMKECNAGGNSYSISVDKNCNDFCVGDNPNTEFVSETVTRCSYSDGERLSDPADGNDPGYDPDAEASCPAGYVMEGSQCVGLADTEDDCPAGFTFDFGECSGPPNTDPDPDSGDDSGSDLGDDSGDDSGGDSGDDSGDDSGGGSGDDSGGESLSPSGSETGDCDSYNSCFAEADSQSDCDPDRDIFYFTYVSGSNYFYECSECKGPDSSSYPECNSCPFGYNASTGLCYPVTCPFGDCSEPDLNNNEPSRDTSDNSDIVAVIRDLQSDLNSGVRVTNLSEVTNKLDSISSDIVSEISKIDSELGSQTSQIVDAINDVTQAINDKEISGGGGSSDTPGTTPDTNDVCRGENPPDFCTPCEPNEVNGQYPAGCSDTELKDLLKKLLAVQEEASCMLGSSDPELCPPDDGDEPEFSHEAEAGELYGAFQATEWGGLLTSLETAAAGVSGQCTLNFSIFVPYANKEMTVDICMWLEPIANNLRMFAIAIWGFLGLRHIFSA